MTDAHAGGGHGGHGGLEGLVRKFDELAKPNAMFRLSKPDLDNVGRDFMAKYDGKPVEGAHLEARFNDVAKTYLQALFKGQMNVDGPELYGNMLRDWSSKVGDQHLGQIRNAIKIGDKAQLLQLLNQAYQAGANKTQSVISDIQSQPADKQMGIYQAIAKKIPGSNPIKVASNPGAAYGVLAQQYATAEQLS